MQDFQSIAAVTVVVLTIVVMAYFNCKKKGSCGGGCSCGDEKNPASKKG